MTISSTGASTSIAASAAHPASRRMAEAISNIEPTDRSKTADAGNDEDSIKSAIHSFANGVLGLDDPSVEKPAEDTNRCYNAGKLLAAAGTIGTILSVLA